MTAQEYIQQELDKLQEPVAHHVPRVEATSTAENVLRLLTSKKFRKYALSEEYAEHVRKSVCVSVKANEPIKIVFFGGCYKLWRLDEAPEADWAELFAYMYFTKWLKPICEIYKPGVWFDFLLDDFIVPRLNNIEESDVKSYRASRDVVLDFIKPYQPENLMMTHTSEGGLFDSRKDYEMSLEQAITELTESLGSGLPTLSDAEIASVELNTKVTEEQSRDPKWREKVELLHSAYYLARSQTGYYAPDTNKIISFTQPFAPGKPLCVGSTKDTVAKYWVGVGVLRQKDEGYRQLVLSPQQLENLNSDWQEVDLGIRGKNFHRIRVVDEN